MCQAYEAGGLKMVDVRSFLSALKIGWLKLSCVIMGKLQRFFRIMCPLVQDNFIRKRGGEFANVIMQKVVS